MFRFCVQIEETVRLHVPVFRFELFFVRIFIDIRISDRYSIINSIEQRPIVTVIDNREWQYRPELPRYYTRLTGFFSFFFPYE